MELKEYPSSLPQYRQNQIDEMRHVAFIALIGFIATKLLLTYVIHRATKKKS